MATSSGLFLATIYTQSQLAERKHVARYWSNNTAAMAVPLSARAHPSPLVITTKLAAVIFGGGCTKWPACWAYACSGSLLLFSYCIILLFVLWRIKFSLSVCTEEVFCRPSTTLWSTYMYISRICDILCVW